MALRRDLGLSLEMVLLLGMAWCLDAALWFAAAAWRPAAWCVSAAARGPAARRRFGYGPGQSVAVIPRRTAGLRVPACSE
jgi:hypothetical protein